MLKKEENHHKLGRLVEETSEKNETNIVTSLAEKAMSVAGPVVPTKDGELDQGRCDYDAFTCFLFTVKYKSDTVRSLPKVNVRI